MDRVRAHRRAAAAQGFPLLRGCPSTFVLQRLVALDALTPRDREEYAEEVSDLAWAQAGVTLGHAEREALRRHDWTFGSNPSRTPLGWRQILAGSMASFGPRDRRERPPGRRGPMCQVLPRRCR
ncbi:MAG: hypothetical protein U1E69_22360 [Tabrizicola sp.]|uniref:hypothetical protein n=1 Tax=Tabrizicola sp. TaxID=2005166 RepID=UPI002ABA3E84|nr:hypothetical protein [Tabrizicola sp.]MDZ4089542.1 hypothetical protein [Tabrizicola sp.]